MDDTTGKLPWDTPATVPLTDPESRADEADVLMRNGIAGSPFSPGT